MPSCRVYVIARPRSRQQDVPLVDEQTLRVRVSAPPENGKANMALQALLAKALRVPKSSVQIVAGEHARKKLVELPLTLEEVTARLSGL
ncbi:MAG: DUF167 family protein [Dehalococcoidia bacterium]